MEPVGFADPVDVAGHCQSSVQLRRRTHCRAHPRERGTDGYADNRYYDLYSRQFLSVDPLVDQTLQPYGYANENPANQDDPTGLWSCENPLSGPGLTQQEANAAVLQQCGTGYNNAYPYNQHYP